MDLPTFRPAVRRVTIQSVQTPGRRLQVPTAQTPLRPGAVVCVFQNAVEASLFSVTGAVTLPSTSTLQAFLQNFLEHCLVMNCGQIPRKSRTYKSARPKVKTPLAITFLGVLRLL